MAFTQMGRLYTVFTCPVDGHKFQHLKIIDTAIIDGDPDLTAQLLWRQWNPDAKVLEVGPLTADKAGERAVREIEKRIREEGGPSFRALQGNEDLMSQADVDEAKAERAALLAR